MCGFIVFVKFGKFWPLIFQICICLPFVSPIICVLDCLGLAYDSLMLILFYLLSFLCIFILNIFCCYILEFTNIFFFHCLSSVQFSCSVVSGSFHYLFLIPYYEFSVSSFVAFFSWFFLCLFYISCVCT